MKKKVFLTGLVVVLGVCVCTAATARLTNLSGEIVSLVASNSSETIKFPMGLSVALLDATEVYHVSVGTNLIGDLDMQVTDWTTKGDVFLQVTTSVVRQYAGRDLVQWTLYGLTFGFFVYGTGWMFKMVRRTGHASPEM